MAMVSMLTVLARGAALAAALGAQALSVHAGDAGNAGNAGNAESADNAGAMFRGGPTHAGVYPAPSRAPAGHLLWKFDAGRMGVVSSPAVVGDTVYVGSGDHRVYALDRRTGGLRWKFATQGRVSSSPAVAGGVVYVLSYDGRLYAIDAASGKERWTFSTEGERRFAATHLHGAEPASEVMPDVFDFYLSSPVVSGGVVYFGSGDRHVYAVDAATGALRWKVATADVVHASPAVAEGLVIVGDWDSTLRALDAATGAERWRFQAGRDPGIHNQQGFQSSPAIADGRVFVGCRDAHLYALDLHKGTREWALDMKGSWVIASPAVAAGRVVFATSDSGLLEAVDEKTGALAWQADEHKWPMFSSPAVAGGRVYIGSHRGQVLAVDAATGHVDWRFETDGARQAGSAYTKADQTPDYERAFTDFFYDDMVAGVYRMLAVGTVLSSPVLADGVLFVGSMDGRVYAID
jgi:outer membrane protein assembly factor BamB